MTARVFEPLLKPSRYKGAWGGRGSGKSHFMAGAVVEYCLLNPGARIVCIREVQKTLAQSARLLIENKIQEFGVGHLFRVLYDRIETPGGGLIIFQGMQDQNAESIKSLEAYNVAWCEEAQTLSNRSLALLRPTIRAEGSEIWFSWNPRRKSDAVDQFLRVERPDNAIVVKANWRDNPWFPTVLEEERTLAAMPTSGSATTRERSKGPISPRCWRKHDRRAASKKCQPIRSFPYGCSGISLLAAPSSAIGTKRTR
jgi:phage terminase large subunit